MVRLDVGNYCDGWAVTQQGGIGLIGFGHECRAGSRMGVGACTVELAADSEGRIQSGLLHRGHGHGRGGGFSVGARQQNLLVPLHEHRQKVRAADDRDTGRASTCKFWIVLRDSGEGSHHNSRLVTCQLKVFSCVADSDLHAHRAQYFHWSGGLHIRASHDAPAVSQDAGQTGHAGATNTHHVDAGKIVGVCHLLFLHIR